MLGDISLVDEIYIVCGYTDMRKSIDGLCALVENELHMDPRRSALYLFCGRRCDRIKVLLEQRPSAEWTDNQLEKLAPWSNEVKTLRNHN